MAVENMRKSKRKEDLMKTGKEEKIWKLYEGLKTEHF